MGAFAITLDIVVNFKLFLIRLRGAVPISSLCRIGNVHQVWACLVEWNNYDSDQDQSIFSNLLDWIGWICAAWRPFPELNWE